MTVSGCCSVCVCWHAITAQAFLTVYFIRMQRKSVDVSQWSSIPGSRAERVPEDKLGTPQNSIPALSLCFGFIQPISNQF